MLAESHEIGAGKQALMKAAGFLLARPKLYRAAIAAADSALRVLPAFVVGNSLNSWTSRGRDMPQPAQGRPFISGSGVPMVEWRNSERQGVDPRQDNAPISPTANTLFPSSRGSESMAMRTSSRSLSGIFPAWAVEVCRKVPSNLLVRDLQAGIIASTVSEYEGNLNLARISQPDEVANVDVAIVRAHLGVAETGSVC